MEENNSGMEEGSRRVGTGVDVGCKKNIVVRPVVRSSGEELTRSVVNGPPFNPVY